MTAQASNLLQQVNHATLEAQRGNLKSARETINAIREAYAIEQMPDVSAEIMIAEGVCEAYDGNLDAGYDRLRRAALVAHHFGSQPVEQLALSWLAHCEFNRGHPLESVKHIGQAHQNIQDARLDARFRISSTIAILCEYAGMTEAASNWFRVARREASRCGERAMMSSVLFNMAALRIDSKLTARLMPGTEQREDEHAVDLLFMRSSENYDLSTRLHVQGELHFLMQAQSLSCMRQYSDAIDHLDRFFATGARTSTIEYAKARFERAWCVLMSGGSEVDFDALLSLLTRIEDPDDLALAHKTLALVAAQAGESDKSCNHDRISLRLRHEVLERKSAIAVTLGKLDLLVVPSVW